MGLPVKIEMSTIILLGKGVNNTFLDLFSKPSKGVMFYEILHRKTESEEPFQKKLFLVICNEKLKYTNFGETLKMTFYKKNILQILFFYVKCHKNNTFLGLHDMLILTLPLIILTGRDDIES